MPPQTVSPRKAPKQERSRATVEAILIATVQVMDECGYEKTTTSLIARRAGVSVGSLYQYFPNKESLLKALAEKHLDAVTEHMVASLERANQQPLQDALHTIIGGLLDLHAKDRSVHQIFAEEIPKIGGIEHCREVDRAIEQAVMAHLAQRPERLRPRNLELGVFMLVYGVEGITQAAVAERPDSLDDGSLARELVDMVERYLLAD